MRRSRMAKAGALLAALTLLMAACGSDDEGSDDTTTTTEADGGGGDGGTLVIGRVLPETGDLSFLGPPMIAGFDLAIDDINAAGGVLGGRREARGRRG